MKKLTLLVSVILLLSNSVFAITFTDTDNHNNETAIKYLADKGIIQGYANGSFQPYRDITRAEFLKILMESLQLDLDDEDYCFTDVKNGWYAPYVCTAKSLGIVNGYPDGSFQPLSTINYAEALKMTLESYEVEIDHENYLEWYAPYYWFAKNNGLLEKTQDRPNYLVLRGEMAQLIYNLHEYLDYELEPNPNLTTPACYLSDELKSYKFDTADNTEDYPFLEEDITNEEDCRAYAIDIYNTDKSITKTIVEGDIIELANNITVEIQDIEIRKYKDNSTLYLTTEQFLDDKPLSTVSNTHILDLTDNYSNFNEAFGYRIELIAINEDEKVEVKFIPLTPYINTPKDLYNDCYFFYEKSSVCYVYSLFEPLPNEIEIKTENFVIFGPGKAEEYMQGIGEQLELCYKENVDFMEVEKDSENIPVHLTENDSSGVIVTGDTGIKWGYHDTTTNIYEDDFDCQNNVASHELVHVIVINTPLSDILNEGLATFVANQVKSYGNFSCEENGYYLNDEFYEFGYLNLYTQIEYKEGGSDLYETSACFWDEYYNDFGRANFLETMKLLVANRDFSKPGSTIKLFAENLGINLSPYREKYGFDYVTEENDVEGRAEKYAKISGTTAARWDGNYE